MRGSFGDRVRRDHVGIFDSANNFRGDARGQPRASRFFSRSKRYPKVDRRISLAAIN